MQMQSKRIQHTRLQKEIIGIIHLYTKLEIETTPSADIITVMQPANADEYFPQNITFILNNYPFTMPKLFITKKINNIEEQIVYKKTITHCMLTNITRRLTRYTNSTSDCLACNSFISNIWSPVLTISHIIKDMQRINRLKRIIGYELALDRVKMFSDDIIAYIVSFLIVTI
jgi:hypothetical protein